MTPAWLRGLRAAFMFLTRIPVGGFPYTREELRWAGAYFPVVGALVGLIAGLVQALLGPETLSSALVALGISMIVTGAFHEDGLADTADALGGSFDREKLFVILKDSRVGSFGAAALVVVLGLRAALLSELGGEAVLGWVLASTLGRTPPVWLMAALPYVTSDAESRSRHLTRAGWAQAGLATLLSVFVLLLTGVDPVRALLAVGLLALTAVICAYRFLVRAGGITGDFLGTTEQLGECAVLLALALTRSVELP